MFSKSSQYAIRAMIYIAVHGNPERKIGVLELANELEAPKHYLGKILQQLVKYNLLSSSKGPGGGFYIAKEKGDINVCEIRECIKGPSSVNRCVLGLPECTEENPCPLHDLTIRFYRKFEEKLREQSIRKLAVKIKKEHIKI